MVRIRRVDEGASAGFMCIFSSGYLDSDRQLSTSPVLEMSVIYLFIGVWIVFHYPATSEHTSNTQWFRTIAQLEVLR